jgi:hypothetical protein
MNVQEVIAKLDKLKSEGGTIRENVKVALDTVMDQFTGKVESDFFYALEDLNDVIDRLEDKPLKMKLRKIFDASENLLGKTEKAFLLIGKEL